MGKLQYLADKVGAVSYFVANNLLRKPLKLVKYMIKPSYINEPSYFPELKRKGKRRIWMEQAQNIISHGCCDEYYFMYGHDIVGLNNRKDYVIYDEFMKRRDKLNLSDPHNDSTLLRNKLFFDAIARSINVPTPRILAYSTNGNIRYFVEGLKDTDSWDGFKSLVGETIYCKPLGGQCGEGVVKLSVSPYTELSDLKRKFGEGLYLFQQQVVQHDEMSRLYPHSVNTIRMTTVRNLHTGEIEVIPPTLRIGAHGSIIDNFSQGGIIVAMDTVSGKLNDYGFFKPKYGLKSKTHPDTGIEFSSFKVPFYDEAKKMACYFHSFLNLHSIGWDIAIGPEGPIFIEGNDNWEINLPQTAYNPFKSEFKRLFY